MVLSPFQIISHSNFLRESKYFNIINEESNVTYNIINVITLLYNINLVKLEILGLSKKLVMTYNMRWRE